MSGQDLPPVDSLLRHRRHPTPAGYAQLADNRLVEAAEELIRRLVPAEAGPESGEARHLVLLVRGDGWKVESESIASAMEANLEGRLALLGQWAKQSTDRSDRREFRAFFRNRTGLPMV